MTNSIDLRINNILEYSGYYFKVKSISNRIIGADRNKGVVEFKPSEINPIPLTEEILLKCGFVLMNQWFDYELNGFRLGYITDDTNFQFETCDKVIDIKWLHQLQNIFYFNTGQELNTAGL